ncbi:MAG: precorrin-2 dehydrogenase/sirohydrochlorin ferrochelatase family protein [Conexivisphaera sp.]
MKIPIFIEASALRVLVLGGGSEAEKKARRFLSHGSSVTVYSLEFTDWLAEAGRSGALRLVRGDVRDRAAVARLIGEHDVTIYTIPGLPDEEEFAARECESARKICILSTNAERTMAAMPIEVRAAGMRIAVFSGGKSTLVAEMAAGEVARCLSGRRDLEVLLEAMGHAKDLLKGAVPDHRARMPLYRRFLEDPVLKDRAARGDLEGAMRRVEELVEEARSWTST